jgi:MYXO-CTERM domain-containing protein
VATPVNTTLPGGFSWQPIPGGTYDTGTVGTSRGGFNGQQNGPFQDTSYGVMDEPGTPWFTGGDQSSQQYVQQQLFGNFGTSSPPGPGGFRFYNFGYGSTAAGSNFPSTGTERRGVSLNHWNNPFPDAGGVATFGQVVYVPVSATLVVGQGFGADEMLLKGIGGNGGGTSKFDITSQITSSWTTAAFGGINNLNNRIVLGSSVEFFDPGVIGNYDMPFGFGVGLAAGQISLSNFGTVADEGQVVGFAGQGIPTNSTGVGLSDSYNVLSTLLQDGSSFNLTFDGSASVAISRVFGNADARASMGPGMEGNARLVVQWAAFQAVPTPGAAGLFGLALLGVGRRRR